MDIVDGYLARIGVTACPKIDRNGLATLQAAHLIAVPFENLDVHAGRDVSCDAERAVAKVVERRRGGWCFELNGAFAVLLEHLGFTVRRLAATVLLGEPTPIPDHLTLVVTVDRPYLVDVGFGSGTPRRPLPLDDPGPHHGGSGLYRFTTDGGQRVLERRRRRDGTWERCFRFDDAPVTLADLEPSARHLATTDNRFTASPFATRALDDAAGRVTWNDGRLLIRRTGSELVTPTPDDRATLERWFGIVVGDG